MAKKRKRGRPKKKRSLSKDLTTIFRKAGKRLLKSISF